MRAISIMILSFLILLSNRTMAADTTNLYTCVVGATVGNNCDVPYGCFYVTSEGSYSSFSDEEGKAGAVLEAVRSLHQSSRGERVEFLKVNSCTVNGAPLTLCLIAGVPCS